MFCLIEEKIKCFFRIYLNRFENKMFRGKVMYVYKIIIKFLEGLVDFIYNINIKVLFSV